MSFFETADVTEKWKAILFWKFHWDWRDVGGIPHIIKKITDSLKTVLGSS